MQAVVAAHQEYLDVVAPGKQFFQATRGVDAAESTAHDDYLHRLLVARLCVHKRTSIFQTWSCHCDEDELSFGERQQVALEDFRGRGASGRHNRQRGRDGDGQVTPDLRL